MHHPTTRAERRHERDRIVTHRQFRWLYIWRARRWNHPEWHPDWGRYHKWNMNCGCTGCHAEKYFKEKRKRRRALQQAGFDQLQEMGL